MMRHLRHKVFTASLMLISGPAYCCASINRGRHHPGLESFPMLCIKGAACR